MTHEWKTKVSTQQKLQTQYCTVLLHLTPFKLGRCFKQGQTLFNNNKGLVIAYMEIMLMYIIKKERKNNNKQLPEFVFLNSDCVIEGFCLP